MWYDEICILCMQANHYWTLCIGHMHCRTSRVCLVHSISEPTTRYIIRPKSRLAITLIKGSYEPLTRQTLT
ncbi:hypothetical protein M405DRAFT_323225 [Rhizopogon salebrosus TDB-379]|nr:hypothetical protein M405DRAFT_419982 [Rhizopogon salebrosus TDB-379]KAJ8587124.1 hypothetical protein M405DRAFT_323225 [Rhizopogon salebrosus TDB-379]